MTCTRCGKRLSRKTARIIDGKALCSACLFVRTDEERSDIKAWRDNGYSTLA